MTHRPMAMDGLVVDLFCGGGGASEGIRMALGRAPDVAVNHAPAAIAMHASNHPHTLHLCKSVHDVTPLATTGGRPVALLWLSPDCTHFSRAKGGKPRRQSIRDLAWVAVSWAEHVRPRVICLENVPEFTTWGPLDADGQPIPERTGETFQRFVNALRSLGYAVDWRVLNAADYGAPTQRRRLFLVARCEPQATLSCAAGTPEQAVAWPEPTHGPGRLPYRAAGECIDWSLPTRSIFGRSRPLADKTMARIAEGLRRYVLETESPYWVPGGIGYGIQTRNGERKGQAPRTLDVSQPLNTVTARGSQGAAVVAWMVKHYGGVIGHDLRRTIGSITARDSHAVGTATLQHGEHRVADVAAFLVKYYGQARAGQRLDEPLHTIVNRARFGLVTVELDGEPWTVVDVGMRMLQPRELATAQGFGPEYVLTGTKAEQTARIGNSVPPQVVAAVVAAQFTGHDQAHRMAS